MKRIFRMEEKFIGGFQPQNPLDQVPLMYTGELGAVPDITRGREGDSFEYLLYPIDLLELDFPVIQNFLKQETSMEYFKVITSFILEPSEDLSAGRFTFESISDMYYSPVRIVSSLGDQWRILPDFSEMESLSLRNGVLIIGDEVLWKRFLSSIADSIDTRYLEDWMKKVRRRM